MHALNLTIRLAYRSGTSCCATTFANIIQVAAHNSRTASNTTMRCSSQQYSACSMLIFQTSLPLPFQLMCKYDLPKPHTTQVQHTPQVHVCEGHILLSCTKSHDSSFVPPSVWLGASMFRLLMLVHVEFLIVPPATVRVWTLAGFFLTDAWAVELSAAAS